MPKSGLPTGVKMRHDSHYVEQIASRSRSIGRTIPIDLIFPNPEQPRVEFGDLSELTASIREKGVLEPLLVKPNPDGTFMIIAGERRWRSSKLAGLTEVPCVELDLDENAVAEVALIENLQRKDLTIWEEADGLAALAERFGYTHEQIAQKISKSRTTVTELLAVAGLPDDIRAKCRSANISSKAILLDISRQFDEAAMHEHIDRLTNDRSKPRGRNGSRSGGAKKEQEKAKRSVSWDGTGSAVYEYRSPNGSYSVIVTFPDGGNSKGSLLKALKSAFDDVKARSE